MTINYDRLPLGSRGGMKRYIEHGVVPGSFLTRVLENDLVCAFGAADEGNSHNMREYAAFLYLEAPVACWGSPEKVKAWESKGGMEGGA